MEKENKDILSSFMKKQISQKSAKKSVKKTEKKLTKDEKDAKENSEEKKEDEKEEMSEEEQLEEAKKESNAKAANYDNSEMLKKLIVETVVRYGIIIGTLVVFAIAVIASGPAIMEFFHGLIHNVLFSDIK